MRKALRKISDIGENLACYALIGAFTLGCIGVFLVALKWVLGLVGVI